MWVRPLDGAAARPIAGTEGAVYPFWSPDSKSVAFFSGGKLRRVELVGGAPSVICDVDRPRGAAWGSDGNILYAVSAERLYRVPSSGGAPSPLITLEVARGEGFPAWPQFLPGGRFLYWVREEKPGASAVYAASFAKPQERTRIVATDTNALYGPSGGDGKSYLLWMRGGQ